MQENQVKPDRKKAKGLGSVVLGASVLLSVAAIAGSVKLMDKGLQMPDTLVAKWLVRPLAATSLVTLSSSGGLPSGVGVSTSTVAGTSGDVEKRPVKLGINVTPPSYWRHQRSLMNLAAYDRWRNSSGSVADVPGYTDADGNLLKVDTAARPYRMLGISQRSFRGEVVDIVCRWEGKAELSVSASTSVSNFRKLSSNSLKFTQINAGKSASLIVNSVDAGDPLRNVDCREAGADQNALFDKEYIKTLSGFTTIRFLDWSTANTNNVVTWATRSRVVGKDYFHGEDGMPIEYMIALANETKTNPWFTISWNADDDYVRRFAEMVRERLDPGLVAHIELSNETWNSNFKVFKQAADEGAAEGLSTNYYTGRAMRTAEKAAHVMDIWSEVFAGQMNRIVRVLASQHTVSAILKVMLAFRDTPLHFDAVATAPYFAVKLDDGKIDPSDRDAVFAALDAKITSVLIGETPDYIALKKKYGLRHITYEGGQHVTSDKSVDPLILEKALAIQHDPRMGKLYERYLRTWQEQMGDMLTLYADVGPVNKNGSWGLREDAGQAYGSTPKSRAVQLFQASISK